MGHFLAFNWSWCNECLSIFSVICVNLQGISWCVLPTKSLANFERFQELASSTVPSVDFVLSNKDREQEKNILCILIFGRSRDKIVKVSVLPICTPETIFFWLSSFADQFSNSFSRFTVLLCWRLFRAYCAHSTQRTSGYGIAKVGYIASALLAGVLVIESFSMRSDSSNSSFPVWSNMNWIFNLT